MDFIQNVFYVSIPPEHRTGPSTSEAEDRAETRRYPLATDPSFFTGKKVAAVWFSEKDRVRVLHWKDAMEIILRHCNQEKSCHKALMKLRGQAGGSRPAPLRNSAAGMRSPIRLGKNLYVEGHGNTKYLLKKMRDRILSAIGCDYRHIMLEVQEEKEYRPFRVMCYK